jgi:hypothetical protein
MEVNNMTIRERFAKYTIEELSEALNHLEEKKAEASRMMDQFKAEKNVEFYKIAEKQFNETLNTYLDVKCAYEARINK